MLVRLQRAFWEIIERSMMIKGRDAREKKIR